jgi:DNA-directed RNA polymerase specialized sigma24 family protein
MPRQPTPPLSDSQREVAAVYAPLAVRKGASRYRAAGRPRRLTEDDFTEEAYLALVGFVAGNTHPDGTDRKGRDPVVFEQHLKARLWDRGTNLFRGHSRHRRRLKALWKNKLPTKHAVGGTPDEDWKYAEPLEYRQELASREAEAPDLDTALRQMRALDPLATDCFVLSRGQGLSYEEVAARLGRTVPQVKYRLKKADSMAREIREKPDHEYQ